MATGYGINPSALQQGQPSSTNGWTPGHTRQSSITLPPHIEQKLATLSAEEQQRYRAQAEAMIRQNRQQQGQQALGLGQPGQTAVAAVLGPTQPAPNPEAFHQKLREYHRAHGNAFAKGLPQLEGRDLDYSRLWSLVNNFGGPQATTTKNAWSMILAVLGFNSTGGPGGQQPDDRVAELMRLHATVIQPFDELIKQVQNQPLQSMGNPSYGQASQRLRDAQGQILATAQAAAQVPISSAPKSASVLGQALTHAVPSSEVKPAPALPRKRLRIEYSPVVRPAETLTGYEVGITDYWSKAAEEKKRARRPADLGVIDIYSVIMSLKSRIPSEVVYALNALEVIGEHIRADPSEAGLAFPLSSAPDLVDEMVGLLEDAMEDRVEDVCGSQEPQAALSRVGKISATYRAMTAAANDEDVRLRDVLRDTMEQRLSIKRVDVILSLLNIFRAFALARENVQVLVQHDSLVSTLVRLCSFEEDLAPHLALTYGQMLSIRKDVLQILTDLALDLTLDKLPEDASVRALFRLVTFFIDPPESASTAIEPTVGNVGPYTSLAVHALARLASTTASRTRMTAAIPARRVREAIDVIVSHLPLTPADFGVFTTNEIKLAFVENLTLALFNLIMIASPDVRRDLRQSPSFAPTLFRIVTRLYGYNQQDYRGNPFAQLCNRCLDILRTVDGRKAGPRAKIQATKGAWRQGRTRTDAWFGGQFDGAPVEEDRSAQDQDAVTSLGLTSSADSHAADAPILTGQVWKAVELLSTVPVIDGQTHLLITSLASTVDPN